ncbi:MAG: hypothetical protein AAF755_14325 [Pseudomonadota bacterium]
MPRYIFGAILMGLLLPGCSGSSRGTDQSLDVVPVEMIDGSRQQAFETSRLPFARGPIQTACQADGRAAASLVLCGCVQAIADQSLSAADQRRGARYFEDPAALQEVRQSDNRSNEKFWQSWKAFGVKAEETCKLTES